MERIAFLFDVLSPYAWLAWKRLPRVLGSEALAWVDPVPVLLAGILNAHGNLGPAEIPAKRAYVYRDLMRSAVAEGLTFEPPPRHPFNPLTALRAITAVTDGAQRWALTGALLDATWSEGRDTSDPVVVAETVAACGLDAARVMEAATDPSVKDALRAATKAAADRGVFGVPTWRVGDAWFWGADRLEQVAAHLRGDLDIDEARLVEVLARPAGARRRR